MAKMCHSRRVPMSRPCLTGSFTAVCVLAMSASLALAQSQWKEIPVGYNMPATAMAAAPAGPMPAPFPKAAGKSSYRGAGRDPKPSWEIEFHGGGFWTTSQENGSAIGFAPGTAFTTANSADPSVQVSSYMFGPGAALTQAYGSQLGLPGITSLDATAQSEIGKVNDGPSVGIRLSRDLTSRFNVEFNGDWNAAPISLTDKTMLGIFDTGNTFFNFFLNGALP